jgi:RNA 3'-terminal phosphate cyclase-like protein
LAAEKVPGRFGARVRVLRRSACGSECADYEASFLQLLERVSKGCKVEINDTGTSVRFSPGLLEGGLVEHRCPASRGISYFVEGLLMLAPFAKSPIRAVLRGVTNSATDVSVDHLQAVTLPQLRYVGLKAEEGLRMKVLKRGLAPAGEGEVLVEIPNARMLKPANATIEGFVKRVRGVAFASQVPAQVVNRVVHAARGVLNDFLPDVHIATDLVKGKEAGPSPGFGVHLVAETTAGCRVAAETLAAPRQAPEDVGAAAGTSLLRAVAAGGCVGVDAVPLLVVLMALGPEDVSRLRVPDPLSPQTVSTLRLLKEFFHVEFRIAREAKGTVRSTRLRTGEDAVRLAKAAAAASAGAKRPRPDGLPAGRKDVRDADDRSDSEGEGEGDAKEFVPDDGIEVAQGPSVLLSCVGIGFANIAKKAT